MVTTPKNRLEIIERNTEILEELEALWVNEKNSDKRDEIEAKINNKLCIIDGYRKLLGGGYEKKSNT